MWIRSTATCLLMLLHFAFLEAIAQDVPSDLEIRPAASVLRRYEPETWSALALTGINRSQQDEEALIAVFFEDNPQMQYARRIWVPPRAQRKALLPVLIPQVEQSDRKNLRFSTIQVEEGASGEVVRRRDGDLIIREDMVILDRERIKTALLFHHPKMDYRTWESVVDEEAYLTVVIGRQAVNLSRVTIEFTENFIPPSAHLLDSIDQLVIADDRLLEDAAGMDSIRAWLRNGGRLWVMADRVRPDTVSALLGDAYCYDIVDRVELTDYTLVDRVAGTVEEWSNEETVELVRVLTDAAEVHCEVDGWPAAYWQPYGDGEILFTTLSPPGWITPATPTVESNALRALVSLSSRLFEQRRPVTLPVADVQPVLQERIGYRIPSRSVATSLLASNFLGLLVVGLILARRHKLEHLAWIVPLVTLTVTAIMLGVGFANSQSVPPTLVSMELLRTSPHSTEAHVAGLSAVYSQEPTELPLRSDDTSLVVPDFEGSSVETRRVVWTDDGESRWRNFNIRPGSVRLVHYEQTRELPARWVARAHFGEDGLTGQLRPYSPGDFEDLLVANPPAPNLSIRLRDDGTFTSDSGAVMSREQYLTDTILSDEQRRRQQIYQYLLDPADDEKFPKSAMLFAWGHSPGLDVELSEDFERTATSLATIPLQLERTPPETRFHIPATFVRIESYLGSRGTSVVFNPRSGRWMEDVMRPTNTQLRFRLPDQVLPCQLAEATITMKINAPSRTVLIKHPRPGGDLELETLTNPSGVVKFTIRDPEVLQLDEEGGIVLEIDVSKTARQIELESTNAVQPDSEGGLGQVDNSTWQIDYVRMDVTGMTAAE